MDDWYSSEGNPDLWGLDCEFIEMDNPSCWQSADKTDEQRKEISRRALAREAGMRCDFSQKLDHTCRVINKALQRLPQEQWCLSWSAGNDSTALSLFLRKYMGLKITHVMSNTRLEYPETIRNMHRYKAELEADGVPVMGSNWNNPVLGLVAVAVSTVGSVATSNKQEVEKTVCRYSTETTSRCGTGR